MLDRDPHQCLDQVFEDNLTRHGLRSLDYRLDVQLRDGRANRGGAGGRDSFLLQVRVAFVELPDLAMRAPLEIAAPGVPEIDVRDLLDASRRRRQSNGIHRRTGRHTRSQATPYAASARHSANAIERRCL
jgi:hypothetical protein